MVVVLFAIVVILGILNMVVVLFVIILVLGIVNMIVVLFVIIVILGILNMAVVLFVIILVLGVINMVVVLFVIVVALGVVNMAWLLSYSIPYRSGRCQYGCCPICHRRCSGRCPIHYLIVLGVVNMVVFQFVIVVVLADHAS